jgi:hypothetical protein
MDLRDMESLPAREPLSSDEPGMNVLRRRDGQLIVDGLARVERVSQWIVTRMATGTPRTYDDRMGQRINLMDPDFEPTDEQLIALSRRAFAGVGAAHDAALAQLRQRIRATSVQVLAELRSRGVLKDT